jgi:hypothetical protein
MIAKTDVPSTRQHHKEGLVGVPVEFVIFPRCDVEKPRIHRLSLREADPVNGEIDVEFLVTVNVY